MADLKVEAVDILPGIAQTLGVNTFQTVFPNALAALNIIAHKYLVQWRQFTMGAAIPGTPRRIYSRGDYTKSINAELTEKQIKYVQSHGPWTDWIEQGHAEIDLKPGLLSGPKAREGRRGPYNIVAFRHGIPGTLPSNQPMPINVYNLIKKETDEADKTLGKRGGTSRVVGNQIVDNRRVRSYNWGYQIPISQGGAPKTKQTSMGPYTWKVGKFAKMVRMDTSTSRAKSSQYITFRTVSSRSDPASWIVPPMEGVPIRQAVVDSLKREVETIIKLALEEDLK